MCDMSYQQVSECPWDRRCINPPTMTRSEVRAKTEPPTPPTSDLGKSESEKQLFTGLLNVMMFANKDRTVSVCPVLALRLSLPEGEEVAVTVRGLMKAMSPTEGAHTS